MHIDQLWIYPIKSLRGTQLQEAQVFSDGFKYDRVFMLLKVHHDDSTPSQRRLENMHVGAGFPETALFTAHLDVAKQNLQVRYKPPQDSTEQTDSIEVPLEPDLGKLNQIDVTMHKSPTVGYDMGANFNSWFSKHFGFEVVFAYIGANRRAVLGNVSPKAAARGIEIEPPETMQTPSLVQTLRQLPLIQKALIGLPVATITILGTFLFLVFNSRTPVWLKPYTDDGRWLMLAAPTFATAFLPIIGYSSLRSMLPSDPVITFADVASYLVVSTTSLDDVSTLLPDGETMDVRKFRPNVIVSDVPEAWDEDYWGRLVVFPASQSGQTIEFVLTQNCARCQSINVDFATGKPGSNEAGTVLKKMMKDRRVDKGTKFSPIFGRYGFVTKKSEGVTIRVGDELKVTTRNAERTTFAWPGLTN